MPQRRKWSMERAMTGFKAWVNGNEMVEVDAIVFNPTSLQQNGSTVSGPFILDQHNDIHLLSEIQLLQFTGKHDKKRTEEYPEGQKIWEGDIYKDAECIISVVKMAVDGWALFPVKKGTPVRNLYWHNVCIRTQGEVIGTIHENLDLLEGESQ